MQAEESKVEYYVSPKGNNSHTGTFEQPFRTLDRAAGIMKAGDVCFLREGIYRETLRSQDSGTMEKPIIFEAYQGEKVVISGADLVGKMEAVQKKGPKNGMWKATLGYKTSQVFVNGKLIPNARYPKMGSDLYKPGTVEMTINFDHVMGDFGNKPDDFWKGATIWCECFWGWVCHSARVKSSVGDILYIDLNTKPYRWDGYDDRNQLPYVTRGYIQGIPGLVDTDMEWAQDEKDNLFIKLPADKSPEDYEIEAKHREYAIDLSDRQNVQIKGMDIIAASAFLHDACHCIVDNCRFSYITAYGNRLSIGFNRDEALSVSSEGLGIAIGGKGNKFMNCSVCNSEGDGLSVYGENNTISNCLVFDCCTRGNDCAVINTTGSGHVFQRNTLYNSGRSIFVHRYLRGGKIIYNDMYNAGRMMFDLGTTYTYNTDGAGTEIAYNWVHDNLAGRLGGAGIYLDNGCRNHTVHHNVIWNINAGPISCGLGFNMPQHDTEIFNNTFYWNTDDLPRIDDGTPEEFKGCSIYNNIVNGEAYKINGVEYSNNYEGYDADFVNAPEHDFRLKNGSPCIAAGINNSDIGAYEYGKEYWKPGCSFALPNDTPLSVSEPACSGELERKGWRATASVNSSRAFKAIDCIKNSFWDIGFRSRVKGMWFCVDMGRMNSFSRIKVESIFTSMHPNEYEAFVSRDGDSWKRINAVIDADTFHADFRFESTQGRYIKVAIAESHLYDMWNISNFCIFG